MVDFLFNRQFRIQISFWKTILINILVWSGSEHGQELKTVSQRNYCNRGYQSWILHNQ